MRMLEWLTRPSTSADDLGEVGRRLLELHLAPQRGRWCARVVDDLLLEDDVNAVRERVYELRLDEVDTALPLLRGDVLLPVLVQDRDVHTRVRCLDASGGSLGRLNFREERTLLAAGLVRLASEVLGRDVSAEAVAGYVQNRVWRRPTVPDEDDAVRALLRSTVMRQLLEEVEGKHFVVVLVPPAARLVRLVVPERVADETPVPLHRLDTRSEIDLEFDVSQWEGTNVGYHVNVAGPSDVRFSRVWVLDDDGCPLEGVKDNDPAPNRLHIYLTNERPPGATTKPLGRRDPRAGVAGAVVAPRVNGVVHVAPILLTATAVLVFALAGLYEYVTTNPRGTDVETLPSATTTVLLAVPALGSSLLAASGKHPLTRRLRAPMRLRLAAAAVLLYAAALSLVVDLSDADSERLGDLTPGGLGLRASTFAVLGVAVAVLAGLAWRDYQRLKPDRTRTDDVDEEDPREQE